MAYYIVVSEHYYGTLPSLKTPFKDIPVKNIVFTNITDAYEYKEHLEKEHNLDFIVQEFYLKN